MVTTLGLTHQNSRHAVVENQQPSELSRFCWICPYFSVTALVDHLPDVGEDADLLDILIFVGSAQLFTSSHDW